jgi:hypothetical protein
MLFSKLEKAATILCGAEDMLNSGRFKSLADERRKSRAWRA